MYQLIGIRHSSGKDQTGKEYSGYSLYIVKNIPEAYGKGQMFSLHKGSLASVFLPDQDFKALGLEVGCQLEMFFNENGYVEKSSIRRVK